MLGLGSGRVWFGNRFLRFPSPPSGICAPRASLRGSLLKKSGNALSSQVVSNQVLSARKGLTSVFGMRTGGSLSPSSPEFVEYVSDTFTTA